MQSALSASDRRSAPLRVTFFRIPCALMTEARFSDLSAEAKLLYGLLLDRVSLSEKNGWRDEQGRVYIYFRVGEIGKVLGCGKDKSRRLLRELEAGTGAGLIECIRQGLCKPNRIYVLLPGDAALFSHAPEEAEPETADTAAAPSPVLLSPGKEELLWEDVCDESGEPDEACEPDEIADSGTDALPSLFSDGGVFTRKEAVLRPSAAAPRRPQEVVYSDAWKSDLASSGRLNSRPPEVGFSDFRKSDFATSGRRISGPPEVSFSAPNQIEYNQIKLNQIKFNQIDPSIIPPAPRRGSWEIERCDAEALISEQIDYERLLKRYDSDAEFVMELLTETALSRAQSIRIGGEPLPAEAVKARFADLNYEHIDYVLSSLRACGSWIRNIRGYLLTALYRAPATMDAYYGALVRHDFAAA